MVSKELLDEFERLSLDEQLALLETLSQRIRRNARLEAVKRLSGILGMHDNPPTDEEVKADYIAYLEEKYK